MLKHPEATPPPESVLSPGAEQASVAISESDHPLSGERDLSATAPPSHEVVRVATLPPTSGVRATRQRPMLALNGSRTPGWNWILKQVAQSPVGLTGCPPRVQEEARRLAREAGQRALYRFDRLSMEDREEIIAAALDRFCHKSPLTLGPRPAPAPAHIEGDGAIYLSLDPPPTVVCDGNSEPYFRHAVRCEAIALTERRFREGQRGEGRSSSPNGELDFAFVAWLDQARRRTPQLQGLERRVFISSVALDSVAAEHEVFKVALYTAIALKLRLNSVHKHMSRARQKLFNVKGREAIEWTDAWKYLDRPSDQLAKAARAYLAACRARGTGDAVVRWAEAHDEHRQRFNHSKEHSARALGAWRAFVDALDASKVRPCNVQTALLDGCVDLGIDHRVIESKIKSGQSWGELLISVDVKRPGPDERQAWRTLLHEHRFGAEVDARFVELEDRSNQADAAKAGLNQAYRGFLDAAAQSPDDLIRKRDEFLTLVDAA